MSTWLASSMKLHSFLVWLLTWRTKVVTMGAPLNKYGLLISLFSIVFNVADGVSDILVWRFSPCRNKMYWVHVGLHYKPTLFFAAFFDDDDDGWSLVSDLEWEKNLGGEKEGRVKDREASVFRCWDGEDFGCGGWGGIICAGHWGWSGMVCVQRCGFFSVFDLCGWFWVFIPPLDRIRTVPPF